MMRGTGRPRSAREREKRSERIERKLVMPKPAIAGDAGAVNPAHPRVAFASPVQDADRKHRVTSGVENCPGCGGDQLAGGSESRVRNDDRAVNRQLDRRRTLQHIESLLGRRAPLALLHINDFHCPGVIARG